MTDGGATRSGRTTAHATSPRTVVGVAVAYAVQAVVLAVVLVTTGARTSLPVTATFRADAANAVAPIASIHLGWAVSAVLAGGAVTFAVAAALGTRRRTLIVAGWSQGGAIVVFLVAQLNGITEVTSLVPLYAIAATAVILVGIDGRPEASTWQRPGAWAAAVGIVPWGVIAFAQIGAGIAVGTVTVGVRIVTLLALAVAVLGWYLGWRRSDSMRLVDLVAMTVGVSVVAWATVAFETLSAG